MSSKRSRGAALALAVLVLGGEGAVWAGQAANPSQATSGGNASSPVPGPPVVPTGIAPPADYVIGPDDVLAIVFWREKDISAEVAVRPDGQISLPLLNDIQAAGLTPEALRLKITEMANKYIEQPTVAVVVKQINSRKVYVTGQVGKPGAFPLTAPMTVVQLLTVAGGVNEFADEKNISILRVENGQQVSLRFNYNDVKKRKNLAQNIELKPGDTVVVP